MKPIRESSPLTTKQERLLVKLAIEASRTDHPNPERRGCPGEQALSALAKREVEGEALGALVDHIAECTPCFQDYERRRAAVRYRQAAKLTTLVVIAVGLTLLIRSHGPDPQSAQTPGIPIAKLPPAAVLPTPPISLNIDLRFSAPARGPGSAPGGSTSRLPRALLNLQLQLPLGSAEGQYEASIHANGIPQIASVKGRAEYRNQMEILDITMDTRTLSPGRYELRLRHAGSAWQRFPILVE